MQATDSTVIFVRAWIAAATVLGVCAFGCRQVDSCGPGSSSMSLDRPQSLPGVAPATSSARIIEVCRVPTEEAGEGNPPGPTGEIAAEIATDEIVPPSCNHGKGSGAAAPFSCGDGERLPPNFGDATKGFAEFANEPIDLSAGQPPSSAGLGSCVLTGRGHPLAGRGSAEDRGFQAQCGAIFAATRDNVFRDYANYYSRDTLIEFTVILAPAAVFANTDWDADVGNWYQEHIRSNSTNRTAAFFRPLGNGYYTIPFYVSAKLLGEYFDDWPGMPLLGEWGDRAVRALAVGAPPLLAVQYLTGGGRPSSIEDNSYWRPFHASYGASGHAFMGAVPFLTLAGMTDDPLAKCFFYACSPWTGFSRINDNLHYLSQVWLGWWMAYLACDAVDKTEKAKGPLLITPLCTPEMTGIGFIYQH